VLDVVVCGGGIYRISLSFPSSTMSTKVIMIPTVHDVIMGRGKRIDIHPGNMAFRRLIWTQRTAYLSAGRNTQRKRCLAEWVVNQVIDSGGRFVTKAGPSEKYCVVSVLRAMEKTTQALREKRMKKPPSAKASASLKSTKAPSCKTVALKAPASQAAKASKGGSVKSQSLSSKKTSVKASVTTSTNTTSLDDMLLSFDPWSDDDLFGEWFIESGGVPSITGHRVPLSRTAIAHSAIKTRTGAAPTRQASKTGRCSDNGISTTTATTNTTTTTTASSQFAHSDIMDKDTAGSSAGVILGVTGINSHHHNAARRESGNVIGPERASVQAVTATTVDNGPLGRWFGPMPAVAATGTKESVLGPAGGPHVTLSSSLSSMMMNPLLRNGGTTSTTSLLSLAANTAEHGAAHRWGNTCDTAVRAFEHVDDHDASGDAHHAFRHSDDRGLGGNPPAMTVAETTVCSDPSLRALWDPNLAYLWFYPLDSSSSHPLLHDESDNDDSDFEPLKVWHTLLSAPPDHASGTPSPLSRD
jgi:hypothetical protein